MRHAKKHRNKSSPLRRVATAFCLGLCIVLGLLVACNLTIVIKGTVNPDRPPSVFGITPMVVLSGSMSGSQEGHIEVGDLVFMGSADPEKLEVGDVIAYMSGSIAVTHRITSIETDEDGSFLFTTKGDANETEDTEPVGENQLVGAYLGRIPKVGDLVIFLQKPLGMMLFVGVPLLAFIVYDIVRRQRFANRERKKSQEMEKELSRLRSLTGEKSIPMPVAGGSPRHSHETMQGRRPHAGPSREISGRQNPRVGTSRISTTGRETRSDQTY